MLSPIRTLLARIVAPALRSEWRADDKRSFAKTDRRIEEARQLSARDGEALARRLDAAALAASVSAHLRGEWRRDDKAARLKIEERIRSNADEAARDRVKFDERIELSRQRTSGLADEVAALKREVQEMQQELRLLHATVAINAEHRERRHPAEALDADRVRAHIRRAIACAQMGAEPMAHLSVTSLLPDDTYCALLDALPPRFFFTHGATTKPDLKLGPSDIAPEWTHRCVRFLQEVIVPEMVAPLLDRFGAELPAAYAEAHGPDAGPLLAAAPHEATGGRLMVRRRGYHIDPHLDPRRSIVTCLIYLARPGDDEAYGTQLFQIDGSLSIDRTNTYYPERHGHACTLVKTVPFRPNSAVAFLNAGGAHGADIPKDAPESLERYSYQFYISADQAAVAGV
jgi:hypothetical protein